MYISGCVWCGAVVVLYALPYALQGYRLEGGVVAQVSKKFELS